MSPLRRGVPTSESSPVPSSPMGGPANPNMPRNGSEIFNLEP